MSGRYLYCQNETCGIYLGSEGGDDCPICDWRAGRDMNADLIHEQEDEQQETSHEIQ